MTATAKHDRAALMRDYEAGLPIATIARLHGVGVGTVWRIGRADEAAHAARLDACARAGKRMPWGDDRARAAPAPDVALAVPAWVPAEYVETYRNIAAARDEFEAAARVRTLKRRMRR